MASTSKLKTLVIHVSHQSCPQFEVFLRKGLFESDDVTFVLVRNNVDADPSSFFPIIYGFKNVHVLIRDNIGLDFQAWNETLYLSKENLERRIIKEPTKGENPLYKDFDRFIFLNATISGPFLPRYVKDNWVDCFTSPLSSTVKLVGLTINHLVTYPVSSTSIRDTYGITNPVMSHIQSMIFATDVAGLEVLCNKGLFSPDKVFPSNKVVLIMLHEVAMTSLIFDAGYEVF